MTLTKKHYVLLIVGLVALAAVYYFLFRKKDESSFDPNLLILGGPDSRTLPVPAPRPSKVVIPGVKPFALNPRSNNMGGLSSRVKLTAPITNKPQGCPQGSHQTQLADGTFSCVPNAA